MSSAWLTPKLAAEDGQCAREERRSIAVSMRISRIVYHLILSPTPPLSVTTSSWLIDTKFSCDTRPLKISMHLTFDYLITWGLDICHLSVWILVCPSDVCQCVCISRCMSVYLDIFLEVPMPVCRCLSLCLSRLYIGFLYIWMSTLISFWMCGYLDVHLSVCVGVLKSWYMSAFLFICLDVFVSVCPDFCLSQSGYLSECQNKMS